MAKILIIDDSATITNVLSALLKKRGHDILTAEDGVAGLNLAKSEKPDLILLDIMLPKLNGYEVCNILKMDTHYRDIKIVMFTAKMSEESQALSIETGANAFMTKESDPELILAKVEEILKGTPPGA